MQLAPTIYVAVLCGRISDYNTETKCAYHTHCIVYSSSVYIQRGMYGYIAMLHYARARVYFHTVYCVGVRDLMNARVRRSWSLTVIAIEYFCR